MGPILGAIIAAATSGLFSAGGTIMQNKYNSPRSQRRRLRKAGLPLAYMYGGNVSQQSDVPKLSIDPDLGASEQASYNLQKELQPHQIEKIAADIGKTESDTKYQDLLNELKGGELDWLKSLVNPIGPENPNQIENNQTMMLNLDKQIKLTASWIEANKNRILSLQEQVEDAMFREGVTKEQRRQNLKKVKQQITNLLSQDKLMGQLHTIRGIEETINNEVTTSLDSMDDFGKAFFSILMRLFKDFK